MHKQVSVVSSCYRGEKYLRKFLESIVDQSILDQIEVVLVHNDPTDAEQAIVSEFVQKYPGLISHITVPREPLYTSWNRAIQSSHGTYIALGNVDDLRTKDSLERMVATLAASSDAVLTYGDYIVVGDFGSTQGQYITTPKFSQKEFIESMHCGPFALWKRSLHDDIGYFDEQLKSGSDYDFFVRAAIAGDFVKTPGNLGYYLNAREGLSTKQMNLQQTELAVIQARYGVYHKLSYIYHYFGQKKYDLAHYYYNEEKYPVVKNPYPTSGMQYIHQFIWNLFAIPLYIVIQIRDYLHRK